MCWISEYKEIDGTNKNNLQAMKILVGEKRCVRGRGRGESISTQRCGAVRCSAVRCGGVRATKISTSSCF